MTRISGIDHVAILVRDTAAGVERFTASTGFPVVHEDVLSEPAVRLTYLDAGNAFVQLMEPLDPTTPLARELAERGEGLHHLCLRTPDPIAAAAALAGVSVDAVTPGRGRGRVSAFVPGPLWHGVRIECTEG